MPDNVEINIKAIVQGLDAVRFLVREIEKLPGAGKGIKGLSAQFDSVHKSIQDTVKELDKAGNELKALGTDTQRVMNQAAANTAKLPKELNNISKSVRGTKSSFAEAAQGATALGRAFTQAIRGDAIGALQSLGTALKSSLNVSLAEKAVTGIKSVGAATADTEKLVTKFASVLGTAAKNAQGSLAGNLFTNFGIQTEQALLNPELALQKFVSHLSAIPDATDRASEAASVFGASTSALLPSLEGMVAAEQAAGIAAEQLATAQAAVTTATEALTIADTEADAAEAVLDATIATGVATTAELTAARVALTTAIDAQVAAELELETATAALLATEQGMAVVSLETAAAEDVATVSTLGLGSAMAIASAGLLAILAVAGGVVLGGFAISKSFADAGTKIQDLSEKTGLAAETLSALKLAAGETHTEFSKVETALPRLAKNLNEAAGGNKNLADTFKQMGVDVKKGTNDTDAALAQFLKHIQTIPEGGQRADAVIKAFGKSGADLIPIFNRVGTNLDDFKKKALELGGINKEQAEAAAKFTDAYEELSAALTGVKNTIGADLLPTLMELITTLKDFVVDNKQGFSDLAAVIAGAVNICIGAFYLFGGTVAYLTNLVYGIANAALALLMAAYQLSGGLITTGKALYAYFSGDVAGSVKIIQDAVRDAKFAIADLNQELKNSADIIATPTFTSFFKFLNGDKSSAPTPPKAPTTNNFRGGGAPKKPKVDPEVKALHDALIEAEKTFQEIRIDILRDGNKREQSILAENFKNNLITYEDYYNELTILQLRDNALQIQLNNELITIEQKALAEAKKRSEQVKIQTSIDKLAAENTKLLAKQSDIAREGAEKRNDAEKEYLKTLQNIHNEILKFSGHTAEAGVNEINERFKDDLKKAKAKTASTGDDTDEKAINQLKALLVAQAQFNDLQDKVSVLLTERTQQETTLNNQVERGIITRTQANEALVQFEDDQKAKINELITQMGVYADSLGDPKLQQAIKDIQLGLESWDISDTGKQVDDLKGKLQQVDEAFSLSEQQRAVDVKNGALTEQQANEDRKASLATYTAEADKLLHILEDIAVATSNTDLQAYVDKARAGLNDLAADGDDLATELNQNFIGAFTDLFTSIADGTKTAGQAFADFGRSIIKILADIAIKALITQLALKLFGGATGGQGGAGGFFSGLFGGDKATGGHAKGGWTGDGDVTDPSGFVHNQEFVIKAPYAARNRQLLEDMNAGINPSRALNAGANVSPAASIAAAASGQNIQINNVLPNDLLDNYVSSGNGVQTILNVIEDNATAINGRLKQANG